MSDPTDDEPRIDTPPVSKQVWPILAVGLTIAGMLVWMGWLVTRPEEIGREGR